MTLLLIIILLVILYINRDHFSFIGDGLGDIKQVIKHYRQRSTRGYSDRDARDIELWATKILPDMLRYFSGHTTSYPLDCKSLLQWQRELNKMASNIEAFDIWDSSDECHTLSHAKDGQYEAKELRAKNKTKKGLHQFADRFLDLWG